MNRAEIGQLLHVMLGNYPNTKIKDAEAAISAWEMAFADYQAEDVYKAARMHLDRSKFFPTIAEIKSLIPIASIAYMPAPDPQKKIEASKTCYTVDDITFDMLTDTEPAECCLNCPKKSYCYGD